MSEDVVPNVALDGAAAVPAAPSSNLVEIACSCVGSPHETDTIILAPELPLELGIAASAIVWGATNQAFVMGQLAPIFLRFGIIGWSLEDADGKPEPLTEEAIVRRLPYAKGGYEVVEAASKLYSDDLMRPLRIERERLLARGPRDGSTSATNGSGRRPRKPSAPSSPTGTAGQAFVAPET